MLTPFEHLVKRCIDSFSAAARRYIRSWTVPREVLTLLIGLRHLTRMANSSAVVRNGGHA